MHVSQNANSGRVVLIVILYHIYIYTPLLPPHNITFLGIKRGVDSGFRHVTAKAYRPRLLHLKGKMNVVATQVEADIKSLNSGDVFIFDAGLKISVWIGKFAGPMEKAKGATIAQALDDGRNR